MPPRALAVAVLAVLVAGCGLSRTTVAALPAGPSSPSGICPAQSVFHLDREDDMRSYQWVVCQRVEVILVNRPGCAWTPPASSQPGVLAGSEPAQRTPDAVRGAYVAAAPGSADLTARLVCAAGGEGGEWRIHAVVGGQQVDPPSGGELAPCPEPGGLAIRPTRSADIVEPLLCGNDLAEL